MSQDLYYRDLQPQAFNNKQRTPGLKLYLKLRVVSFTDYYNLKTANKRRALKYAILLTRCVITHERDLFNKRNKLYNYRE